MLIFQAFILNSTVSKSQKVEMDWSCTTNAILIECDRQQLGSLHTKTVLHAKGWYACIYRWQRVLFLISPCSSHVNMRFLPVKLCDFNVKFFQFDFSLLTTKSKRFQDVKMLNHDNLNLNWPRRKNTLPFSLGVKWKITLYKIFSASWNIFVCFLKWSAVRAWFNFFC